jgi:hypothetical protein
MSGKCDDHAWAVKKTYQRSIALVLGDALVMFLNLEKYRLVLNRRP